MDFKETDKEVSKLKDKSNLNPFDNCEYQTFDQTSNPSVSIPGYRWIMDNLPTSDPGVAGMLWNSSGNIVISGYTPPADPSPYITGMMMEYAGTTSPTSQGWLLLGQGFTIGNAASGATYASADYSDLFDLLKSSWGNLGTEVFANDDTVLLPDPTAASFVGAGTSSGYTADETTAFGTKYDDQFQDHHHLSKWGSQTPIDGQGIAGAAGGDPNKLSAGSGSASNTFNIDAPVSDGVNGTPRTGTTTHGKLLGVNYIIKY